MDVDEAIEAIRTMEVRGAAKIGRTAATALAEAAETHDGPPGDVGDHLVAEAKRLLETRPTAVSLRNALNFVLARALAADDPVGAARDAADAFVERSHAALDAIWDHGAARIPDGGTVLTHCNSQAALGGIVRAHEQGKTVDVLATESRPFRQGRITVEQLAKAGVPATFVVDSAVATVIGEADLVLAGADRITSDGTVVNKIGTRMVALLAREADVPFYTCAETTKLDPGSLAGEPVPIEERPVEEVVDPGELPGGVEVRNPVFDATPPRLVTALITEVGVVSPHAAARLIAEHLGEPVL